MTIGKSNVRDRAVVKSPDVCDMCLAGIDTDKEPNVSQNVCHLLRENESLIKWIDRLRGFLKWLQRRFPLSWTPACRRCDRLTANAMAAAPSPAGIARASNARKLRRHWWMRHSCSSSAPLIPPPQASVVPASRPAGASSESHQAAMR